MTPLTYISFVSKITLDSESITEMDIVPLHSVGRLLLFAAAGSGDSSVDMDMMSPTKVFVAAKEIVGLAPGEAVDIDADDVTYSSP